ncbi:MAG: hypothetical protein GC181_06990 [Bacteroidetes bacterium]|nr:hypothetical protein [Bacteroidota bacterium]
MNTGYPVDSVQRTIHVFVALCDNKYQGIVPVPAAIGNGQDPDRNLYWGCGYGVRTFFSRSAEWKTISKTKMDSVIFERIIFQHKTSGTFLVADAYNGKEIKRCTNDFLSACCGLQKDTLHLNKKIIGISGYSKLLAYTGHDGLMDFQLTNNFKKTDSLKRSAIILACYSKAFFNDFVESSGAEPLLWTTGLMCPEAYTLHDALAGFIANESPEQIRSRAAAAYNQYQKCGIKGARNLLVTGN